MKTLVAMIAAMLLISIIVQAQVAIISDLHDVEISWDTETWSVPEIISIEYSAEPLLPEQEIGKLGIQTWECLMCDSTEVNPRKAIVTVNIPSMPSPQTRILYLRIRNRYADGSCIGPWSEPGMMKVTGKPQRVNPD